MTCHNGSCVGINEETKLLRLEDDIIMADNTLEFYFRYLYQDALVGCILTTDDNCTENYYWIVNYGGSY